MTLWIIFAVMTAAALLAVLWPLGRKSGDRTAGSDRLVYEDQLKEIDRDHAVGLIGDAEAESARIEISRRLLAAVDAESAVAKQPIGESHARRRRAALVAILVVPLVALTSYLKLGAPEIPGQPAFARGNAPDEERSIASLIGQVENHLARNPNDGAGWEVIAPVYLRLGRFSDAVMARRKAIALNGDSPARESDLGEALVAAADGVVTDEAKIAFQRAVAADAHNAKARYFIGLADEQDGNRDDAAKEWGALLDDAPADAPWKEIVRAALARVTSAPAASSGPSAGDVAAAETMPEAQRTEMIRGMVQRLSDRLHADGNDIDGWIRLVRAYAILGDRDKAKDAAADARRALSDQPDQIRRIDDLVRGLGLEG
ncbi:MAG: c-type cytochrome biogenesis protein CcmI [Xanthobacteraceae bacterium]